MMCEHRIGRRYIYEKSGDGSRLWVYCDECGALIRTTDTNYMANPIESVTTWHDELTASRVKMYRLTKGIE